MTSLPVLNSSFLEFIENASRYENPEIKIVLIFHERQILLYVKSFSNVILSWYRFVRNLLTV